MQNPFGTAGKSVREMAKRRRRIIYFILIIVIFLTVVGVIFLADRRNLPKVGGWALAILAFLYLLPSIADLFLKKPEKEYGQMKRGAVGEEQVGALLAQLDPKNYVVMHDQKSPYGNIDHIVYDSRGTIFLLETKSHSGTVTSVNGKLLLNNHNFEKDIIKQALDNAYWLKEKLEKDLGVNAWITVVLVFTNAFVAPGKPIKNVHCVNKLYLLKFIQRTKASSPTGMKLWEKKNYIF